MPNAASVLGACCVGAALSCAGPAVEVEAVRPARRDIESALTTNGRIEAGQVAAVRAAASGRVGQIYAARGARLQRGQPLLRMVDAGQAEARNRARARLAAAKARLVQLDAGLDPLRRAEMSAERADLEAARARASEELAKLRRLLSRGAVARSEVDRRMHAVQDLTANIAALDRQLQAPPLEGRRSELAAAMREAEAELRAAEQSLESLVLRSPAAGTLFSLAAKTGDFLEYGSLAARIGRTDSVRVRVFVDEPDLGRITQGCIARISADAYPGREWDCRVETLATEVIQVGQRRVGEALCRAASPDRLLLPGLAVRVRVVTQRAEQVLSVPRAAVMHGGDRSFAWVSEDGRAVQRAVSLGVVGPVYAEIESGLAESDLLALPGDRSLVAGQRLRLRGATGGAP